MLKTIFTALVVVNTGLFAYNTGLLGDIGVAGREPARLKNQLNAQAIRVEQPQIVPARASPYAAPAVLSISAQK